MDFLNEKSDMLTAREMLFEFMDLSDDLLKKQGLKTKIEYNIRISNKTFWRISHRKELNLPDNFFLNRFWQKFYNIIFYTFDLLDNGDAVASFAELEQRYIRYAEHSLDFYLMALVCWMNDSRRKDISRYSSLLQTARWKSLLEERDHKTVFQKLAGKGTSGTGSSNDE